MKCSEIIIHGTSGEGGKVRVRVGLVYEWVGGPKEVEEAVEGSERGGGCKLFYSTQ